jgi:hypothetical protein
MKNKLQVNGIGCGARAITDAVYDETCFPDRNLFTVRPNYADRPHNSQGFAGHIVSEDAIVNPEGCAYELVRSVTRVLLCCGIADGGRVLNGEWRD